MTTAKLHRLIALVIGIVTLAGLSACGSSSSSDSSSSEKGPITIGFVVGRTGVLESYDLPAETMAKFAIDDINKAGGINGRQIKTVEADMKSQPNLAGNAATQVISQGADVLVLPCDFDLGAPAAVVAQDQGKIGMSLCAASTNFGPSGIGDLAYTMGLAGVTEGAAAAEWAYDKQKYRSAYVLYDTTLDQNKQATDAFTKTWARLGGKLAGEDTFKQTDQSIGAQVSRIAGLSKQPDFLYVSSYQPGFAKAIKQIRAAGIDTTIIGGSDLDGDYWKGAVPGLSDVYFTAMGSIYGDDPDPQINKLIDRYKKAEGKAPDVSAFVAGYAVIQALQKAIQETGGSTDGKAMTEKMQTFTNEPFVLKTTFTPTEHISLKRSVRVMKIQNGKTSFVTLITPSDIPTPSG